MSKKRLKIGSKGTCDHIDIETVKEYIENSTDETSVYLGVDSKRFKKNGKWFASYARAIVVHKNSKNGCKIFGDIVTEPDYGNLSVRLLRETQLAIELAEEFREVIGERVFELHLDLNPDKKAGSSIVINEATGWVRGQLGIDVKVKPYAFAATYAADMAAKRKLIAPLRVLN